MDSLKHGLFFGIGNSLAHNMVGSIFHSNTPEQKAEHPPEFQGVAESTGRSNPQFSGETKSRTKISR
jgi:hypothetical protein